MAATSARGGLCVRAIGWTWEAGRLGYLEAGGPMGRAARQWPGHGLVSSCIRRFCASKGPRSGGAVLALRAATVARFVRACTPPRGMGPCKGASKRRIGVGHHWCMAWIDTHCHLDAPEFAADRDAVRARARQSGVVRCVLPAVLPAHFADVQAMAHTHRDAYALGIHPLYVRQVSDDAPSAVAAALQAAIDDPLLVAVGEIGLDRWDRALLEPPLWQRQEGLYRSQLQLARQHRLPVIVHARRSVDWIAAGLRAAGAPGGIVHAFNGSAQQARVLIDLGMALGFGGACTFDRALQLRRLAQDLPLDALVLETDAPDIPPQWLYTRASERTPERSSHRNEPGELPAIARVIAQLRGIDIDELAAATTANALRVLPRLALLAQEEVRANGAHLAQASQTTILQGAIT